MRKCDNCTMCCQLLPVPVVNENINTTCQYCKNSECSIYKNRPEACKEFNCEWLLNDDMSDDLRPDRCNVIFEKIDDDITLCLVNYEDLNAWKTKIVVEHMRYLKSKGISTIISSYTNEPKRFMLVDGKTEEEIMRKALKKLNR